jgi:hypothetical protein
MRESRERQRRSVAEFCDSIGTQAARALGQLAGRLAAAGGRQHHYRCNKPEQVERNVGALGWKPTPEDLTEIDRITREP